MGRGDRVSSEPNSVGGLETDWHATLSKMAVDLGTLEGAFKFVEEVAIPGARKAHGGRGIRCSTFSFVRCREDCLVLLNPVTVPRYSDGSDHWKWRLADATRRLLKVRNGVGVVVLLEADVVNDKTGKSERVISIALEHREGRYHWHAPVTAEGIGEFKRLEGGWKIGDFVDLLPPTVLH